MENLSSQKLRHWGEDTTSRPQARRPHTGTRSLKCWGHRPVCLTTDQSEGNDPAALTPNFVFKNSSLKSLRNLGFLSMSCLFPCSALPCKPFSRLQTETSVCLALLEHKAHKLGFNNSRESLGAQTLASKYHFPLKGPRIPHEMADSSQENKPIKGY